MTTTGFREKLHTPGQHKMGPPTIIRDDEKVRAEYNALQSRRRELWAELSQVNSEVKQTEINIGGLVADGCDYAEYTARLPQLRLQVDALEWGIKHLDGKIAQLKSNNYWLK